MTRLISFVVMKGRATEFFKNWFLRGEGGGRSSESSGGGSSYNLSLAIKPGSVSGGERERKRLYVRSVLGTSVHPQL